MKVAIKLVGGLCFFFFLNHILGIVTPTDFHIFQRGRYTTNQKVYKTPQFLDKPIKNGDVPWLC